MTKASATQPPSSGVTPYLTIPSRGGAAALEFYALAFRAEVLDRKLAEDGERLIHAHLRINGDSVMLSDEFPEYSGEQDVRPRGVTLHLQVADPDAWWARALGAGAEPIMALKDQSWGERYGQVRDPFGHCWSISGPVKSG